MEMMQLHLIYRQIQRAKRQSIIFVLCVALSLTSLVAFNGLSKSIDHVFTRDARQLHGADIIIRSRAPFSELLTQTLNQLVADQRIDIARVHECFSVVANQDQNRTLLARLKVVDGNYPFYGQVMLRSGHSLRQELQGGRVVVQQAVLDRLGLKIGAAIKIGYATLRIQDVLVSEPGQPIGLFSLGPRILVSQADLEALGLIDKGSRIRYHALIKVADETRLDAIYQRLQSAAKQGEEQVDTYRDAPSRLKRFLDNFLFFLNLIGLFILSIAGIGIQGALTALLREKRATIAIFKTLGAGNGFVWRHFMLLTAVLGAIGVLIGLMAGVALQVGLAHVLSDFVPPQTRLPITASAIWEGLLMGTAVVSIFTFLPLYRLAEVRPLMIFRHETDPGTGRWALAVSAIMFVCIAWALVSWRLADGRLGLYFTAAMGALVLAPALFAQLLLMLLKRIRGGLAWRQAVKGLFRPGNATRSIVMTLTAALFVIFSIYLLERNLDQTFVRAYPNHAPNLFFIDLQPDQLATFSQIVDVPVEFYPIIRARVTAVNGVAIDRDRERAKHRDNLARVFNLTYRRHLLPDEALTDGNQLFQPHWQAPQVSILDTVAKMHPMRIGDELTFNIQGVALTARISSIRSRIGEKLSPFFYFVFPPAILENAPQTAFTALRVEQSKMGALQNKVVARLPNVSIIDLSATLKQLADMMKRLSGIVRLLSLMSIGAGTLILISAIYATRAERIVESVYFTILGAKKTFIERVFAIENMIIGMASAGLAILFAQVGAFWVCRHVFDIAYHPFVLACLLPAGAAVVLVVWVGFVASRFILKHKPAVFLRNQADG